MKKYVQALLRMYPNGIPDNINHNELAALLGTIPSEVRRALRTIHEARGMLSINEILTTRNETQ